MFEFDYDVDLTTCTLSFDAASSLPLRCAAVGTGPGISALQRQADGSFTQWQYLATAPYSLLNSTPNAQSVLWAGSPAGTRTLHNPSGWQFLADRLGVSTQSLVFANLLGNGTPVGLALAPASFDGGPNAKSLMVIVFNPDGSTQTPNFYSVPDNPVGILAADFNHDGKDDVVVIGANNICSGACYGPSIAVYMGNGDGTLKPPVYYSGNKGTYNAVAYDFDGDGNLDLAVANATSGDVSILLGKGDGTFKSAVNYPALAQAIGIVEGDFNGDGHADLAVSSPTAISVLPGIGDGTFRTAIGPQGSFTALSGLAAGDFNNDGKLDLAVSDSTLATVSILLGDGAGRFPTQNDYAAGYGIASPNLLGNLYAMDIDGDGYLDVVAASGHPDVLTATPNLSDTIKVFFGRGDGTLIGPPAYRVGTGLNALAVADFNGDGKLDIAGASGALWILLASGGGNFAAPVSIGLGSGVSASGVAAADLRGIGKQDLVVGDANGSGVYVLLNNGSGTFQQPVRYPVGGIVNSVAIADFNGDGKLDIAFCGSGYNGSSATAGILLGNGNGTFQSVSNLQGFGTTPVSLALGDFNHDGYSDLAIVDEGTYNTDPILAGGVVVYLSNGNGSFQNPVDYPAGTNPLFIVAADVNGDKLPDLVVGTENPDYYNNSQSNVAVLLGNSNGTFQAALYSAANQPPYSLAVADVNGDGKADLLIGHCCSDAFASLAVGNGDGTFQAEQSVAGVYAPSAVAAADLTGSGRQDLIAGVAQYYQSYVAIFKNQGTVLQSIAVTPANPSIVVAKTQQFAATGKYSDNSTQILTGHVTWASGNTGAATISTGGLATGAAVGTSTISATFGAVSGSTLLTVTPLSACDIMKSGAYSIADIQYIINEALGGHQAVNDLNADGRVDVVDVQIVMNAVMGLLCVAS